MTIGKCAINCPASKMKVVIVDENCDNKLQHTISMLEFIAANQNCLRDLQVELVKTKGMKEAPKDHFLIAGKTAIHGTTNIIRYLHDYIGAPAPNSGIASRIAH